jgi:beta-glucuronidase
VISLQFNSKIMLRQNFTKTICLVLLLICFTFSAKAQTLVTNTANRNTTSLNGTWNYIIDQYETGYLSFHQDIYDQTNTTSTSAFYNNYHAKNKQELVEYDFDKSPKMTIPHDWNSAEVLIISNTTNL